MIDRLWELLTTFTEEAQQAALAKCSELGLDQNRGVVSLNESFINLNASSNILRDAIEKRKLIQLPLSIQTNLLSILESISRAQTGLVSGADEVVNLTDAIEKLNVYIWQYGFHNLSDEVLGYQEKLNQLKQLELEATSLRSELKKGIAVKSKLEQISSDAETQLSQLQSGVQSATLASTQSSEALVQAQQASQRVDALLEATQGNETKSTQLLESTTQINLNVKGYESQINALISVFTNLKSELETNKATQQALFEEFEGHRTTINDLLGDANRTGMAAAFRSRSNWLILPMMAWLGVFALSMYGLIYIGNHYWTTILDSGKWEQLPVRIALTAPFVWLGWFSAKQYGYTSKLREDYAYKTASAMSFEGYKREASTVNKDMLDNLLDTAIKNLGENPIRIYKGLDNHASPLNEILEKSLKDEKLIDLLKAIFTKVKG